MNTIEIEITIQSKIGESSWPIVVRCKQPDGLILHSKETLQLNQEDFSKLLTQQENEKEYGILLGKALFQGTIRETLIRALAKSNEDSRLRILLSIEAAENDPIKTLHWERLCAPIDSDGSWHLLARDQRIPFSIYIPTIIDRYFPPIGRRDLRALVVIASPSNLGKYQLAPFDVPAVLSGLKESLGEIPYDVLANQVEGALGSPTLSELSKQLTNAKKPYTLLHFVCHGKLLDSGETVLYWATEEDRVLPIPGEDLLGELKNIGNYRKGLPQFTFLCSCETADPRAEGALGGLAQRLVRNLGMPAVVAMTRKVSVETALALSRSFYKRLRESGEVDVALQEATVGLGKRYDITVPALFSRLGGRPLFSERLENRELTDEEIDYGIDKLSQLLQQRAPHATVLQQLFDSQIKILKNTQQADSHIAKQERSQAIAELDHICDQVLDLSFDGLAALGKEPPAYNAECPFPGLSSFGDKKYHKFFFGREELVKELYNELLEDNFLAVIGTSGSGKSSVVLAGLISFLEQAYSNFQWVYITPTKEPLQRLEAALNGVEQYSLLVVDQFEELFTLCQEKDLRQQFIAQLFELAKARKVVITMRADFLGECTFYPELRKRIETRQKLVGPMEPSELTIAMKMQADSAGLRFEAGLSHTILNDVQGEPGVMPLLQYALQELWKRRRGRWLCADEYQALGGVQQAIAKTADDLYHSLAAFEQEQVQSIFLRLTHLDDTALQGEQRRDTRRRVELEDLVSKGTDPLVTRKLVQQLAGEGVRLVVTSRNSSTGKEEVEVAHEALIRYWPMLQNWLNENRADLQLRQSINQAAQEWRNHLNEAEQEIYLIHQGGRLEDAEKLLAQPKSVRLNEEEAEYVLACVQLRQRVRQLEQRRKHRQVIAAVSAAFICAGFAIFAGFQWQKATVKQIQILSASAKIKLEVDQLKALIQILQGAKETKQMWISKATSINEITGSLQKVTFDIREVNRLEGYKNSVTDVSFSPDGKLLASAGVDGIVRISDLHGKEIFQREIAKERIRSINFSPKGLLLAMGAEDGSAKLWDLESNSLKEFPKYSGGVYNITFSPDGQTIATGSGDGIVRLWSLTGNLIKEFPAYSTNSQKKTLWGLSFSPDGKKIATGSGDSTAKLWDLNGNLLREFKHENTVYSVSFSPDGQMLATASEDNTAKLWDLNGKELTELSGHEDWVLSVSFSPDGQILATGSKDSFVRLWNLKGKLLKEFKGHSDIVRSVVFSPDNKLLASAGYDSTVRLWDVQDRRELTNFKAHKGTAWSVNFSPDGEMLVTSGADGMVRLWDLSGEQLEEFQAHKGVVWKVNFSPNGKFLATSGGDGMARLWNLFGKQKKEFKGHQGEVQTLHFSPDGQFLATGGRDGTARLWDLSGKQLSELKGHTGVVMSVSFSPDGKFLATAGKDGMVRLWNLSGQQIKEFKAHQDWINSVIWSYDGQKIVTASNDRTIRFWNLSGHQLKELTGHKGAVLKLRWSKDGKLLATGGADSTARLWDISGQQIAEFKTNQGEVKSVDFSPNGKLLATSGQDGTIKLWPVKGLDNLIEQGCRWIQDYLNNPDSKLKPEERQVCDGIILGGDH